jgi:putative hemolysin
MPSSHNTEKPDQNSSSERYDRRRLSYANTFKNPVQKKIIQSIELLTGQLKLLRCVRKFERIGIPYGQPFWSQALKVLDIKVETPEYQLKRIPKTGSLIVTANHPHGLIDGMVLAELIGKIRTDYKILTRSLLTGVDQIDNFMIPVPFPHEEMALEKNLEMRKRAMAHLKDGGCIVVFPSGSVAASESFWGPVIEREWNPFTAKLIQRSNAAVLPICFPGANSRSYQIANQISATLRQGLLIREVVNAMHKPQAPIVGDLVDRDEINKWSNSPRKFMEWLRSVTLGLHSN